MSNSSLALYYESPESSVVIKKTCLPDTLKPSEVLIEVSALELSHFDVKLKRLSKLTRTKYLGRSFSGRIIEVGSDVKHLQKGERVCGCFKTLTLEHIGTNTLLDTSRHIVFKTPDYMSDYEATSFPLAFGTAWELAFNRSPSFCRSSKVLVMGAGTPVGFILVQLLQNLFKLNDITVTCTKNGVDRARDLGISKIVDEDRDIAPALIESVGGESKFTVIYDCIGGYDSLSVWPAILKSRAEGGLYLTIRGDAPDLNKSESVYSLVKNAAPYIPRNVTRLALGRFAGIDYHFVTWFSIPCNAIDYAMNTEILQLKSTVWNINDVEKALDHLKTLDAGSRVVIDMKSTPRIYQETGEDCPSEVQRYSEYLRYKQIKRRVCSSLFKVVGRDQEPLVLILDSPTLEQLAEEIEQEERNAAAQASNEPIDVHPAQELELPVTPQVFNEDTPVPTPVASSNGSTKSSFNTKFKRIFKKKTPVNEDPISPEVKKARKLAIPHWLRGKHSKQNRNSYAADSAMSPTHIPNSPLSID